MSDYRPKLRAAPGKKLPPHMRGEKAEPVARPEPVESADEGVVVRKRRRTAVDKQGLDIELPKTIRIKDGDQMHRIPEYVKRGAPFKWYPESFRVEFERFERKIIDSELQDRSLQRWLDDPTLPYVYGVTGSPDDSKALYFAAYLAQKHAERKGPGSNVLWHTVYGGFKNELLEDFKDVASNYEPTLLVLTGLARDSTQVKIEKARDLMVRFAHIPRIVVAAGEDPISFIGGRLSSPCHGLAYFSEALLKRDVI